MHHLFALCADAQLSSVSMDTHFYNFYDSFSQQTAYTINYCASGEARNFERGFPGLPSQMQYAAHLFSLPSHVVWLFRSTRV